MSNNSEIILHDDHGDVYAAQLVSKLRALGVEHPGLKLEHVLSLSSNYPDIAKKEARELLNNERSTISNATGIEILKKMVEVSTADVAKAANECLKILQNFKKSTEKPLSFDDILTELRKKRDACDRSVVTAQSLQTCAENTMDTESLQELLHLIMKVKA